MNVKTVEHLCQLINHLETRVPNTICLTRYLREVCVGTKDVKLPDEVFGRNKLCPSCLTPWSAGRFSMRLLTYSHPKKSRKKSLAKLLRKPTSKHNAYQKSLLQRINSKSDAVVKLTCLQCNDVTKETLDKSLLKIEIKDEQVESPTPPSEELIIDELPVKKKKKKRKKDTHCGLNSSVVAQVKQKKALLAAAPFKFSSMSKSSKSDDRLSLPEKLPVSQSKPVCSVDNFISLDLKNEVKNGAVQDSVNNRKEIKDLTTVGSSQTLEESSILSLELEIANSVTCSSSVENDIIRVNNEQKPHKNVTVSKESETLDNCMKYQPEINSKRKNKFNQNKPNKKLKTQLGSPSYQVLPEQISENKEVNKTTNDKKITLLSQPCFNNIIQRKNKCTNVIREENDDRLSKNVSNQRVSSNSTDNNVSGKTNSVVKLASNPKKSLTNGQKPKSKSKKVKSNKINKRNSYKVFEESNCRNSLCVKDLLNLT